MALKFNIETLEGLDEPLHSHYREENGKYVLDVEGAKSAAEVEKLAKALDAERKLHKQVKDSASVWESKFTGKSPDEILAQLERIPILEAETQSKIDQKKLTEVVETTVKQRTAPLEHELTKVRQAVVERDQEIAAFKTAERRRHIHDAVRGVAAKEGFQETTYSNADGALLMLAEKHLTIDSVGNVVVSDDSKFLTPGLAVREALVEIKNHYPYMLKQSMGGGAAGNNGPAGSPTHNPFKSNNMTARAQFMREHAKDPEKVKFAWKQAGLNGPMDRYVGK